MHILEPKQFPDLVDLFQGLEDHLAPLAVLHGVVPGVVIADHPTHPTAALIHVSHRFYLAGDPHNKEFNSELARWFTEVHFPAALEAGEASFSLYYDDSVWEDSIDLVLLKGHNPIQLEREYYRLKLDQAPQPVTPPKGLTFHSADADLLEREDIANLDDLCEEMQSERPSVEEFIQKSLGVCLVGDGLVVTWCLSEYNLGDRCEVGIATHPFYRQRGLAALTARAFAHQVHEHGIREIGWHCWKFNYPSGLTAQTLGYEKVEEGNAYLCLYDHVLNMAVTGDFMLRKHKYDAALMWLEDAIRSGEVPAWVYLDAGRAAARLGNPERALQHLKSAIDMGLTIRPWFTEEEDLASLHDRPEWQEILTHLDE